MLMSALILAYGERNPLLCSFGLKTKVKGTETKGHLINVNSYTLPEFICALTTLVALSFQAEYVYQKRRLS